MEQLGTVDIEQKWGQLGSLGDSDYHFSECRFCCGSIRNPDSTFAQVVLYLVD